jgi:hypothetical protein
MLIRRRDYRWRTSYMSIVNKIQQTVKVPARRKIVRLIEQIDGIPKTTFSHKKRGKVVPVLN